MPGGTVNQQNDRQLLSFRHLKIILIIIKASEYDLERRCKNLSTEVKRKASVSRGRVTNLSQRLQTAEEPSGLPRPVSIYWPLLRAGGTSEGLRR